MAENLTWQVTVRANGGPRLTHSGKLEVEAYDKLSVAVPAGGEVEVDLGPVRSGHIACLVIVPSMPSEDLTYTLDTASHPTITLNEPQFLFGGAVDLTGNPASLTLANGGAEEATVAILVGRDATPEDTPD